MRKVLALRNNDITTFHRFLNSGLLVVPNRAADSVNNQRSTPYDTEELGRSRWSGMK